MKKIILYLIAASAFMNNYGMEDNHVITQSVQAMQLAAHQQIAQQKNKDKSNSATQIIKKNPTEIIVKGSEDEILELLNSGFDPNIIIEYKNGKGPVLHWAARKGFVRIFDYIESKYPEINLLTTCLGVTVLHIAAQFGQVKIFNWFNINHPDIDLNLASTDGPIQGYTPLHCAAMYNQKKIFEWFSINRPAINLNPTSNNGECSGETALWIAAYTNHKKIVDLLSPSLKTPLQCCFLTFEEHDFNESISYNLMNALTSKILSIVTPHVLQKTFAAFPLIKNYCETGRFTLLTCNPANLIVIIPESLNELGIQIPTSDNQKKQPSIDVSIINKKYGLKNLHIMNSQFLNKIIEASKTKETIPAEEFSSFHSKENVKKLINLFGTIIDSTSTHRPACLYLAGHGGEPYVLKSNGHPIIGDDGFPVGYPGSIGAIPPYYFKNFLSTLSAIGAQFLLIYSCDAGGKNLFAIQNAISEITKESAHNCTSGINYAIVVQATTGLPCHGLGNINAMFMKLQEFLQNPSWALEFDRADNKPKVAISDVIASLGFLHPNSLFSIRMPGKSEYFRPLNIGKMEIITISQIIEKGIAKTLELIAQTKSPDTTIADEAKKKLQKPLGIELTIKPDVQYIQIFPTDLTDFSLVIQGPTMPKFISKLPDVGHHFIGEITYTSNERNSAFIGINFIKSCFASIFHCDGSDCAAAYQKCWFIKLLNLITPGKSYHFKIVVIHFKPKVLMDKNSFAYINENNEYIISNDGKTESKVTKETFESTIKSWFEQTKPSQETLNEASGDVEITAEEKEKLLRKLSSNSQLLNPQFQRTTEDLFNQFMGKTTKIQPPLKGSWRTSAASIMWRIYDLITGS